MLFLQKITALFVLQNVKTCDIILRQHHKKGQNILKSKKERLKAQAQKQAEQKKQALLEEENEKAKAKADSSMSSAAVKLLKKEPVYCLVLKLLAAAVYMYSCFFFGLVTVIGIYSGQVNNVSSKYAAFILVGIIILLVSLLLMFFKKYIVSFLLNILGTILYMKTAVFLVEKVRKLLDENYVTDPSVLSLDKTYMKRYYPEYAFLALGGILLAISLVRRFLRYRRKKQIMDNAPVKSIVDD